MAVLASDHGDSNETARGGAMLLDLHAALSLRNSTQRRIRGITLLVTAQEVTPGGKGSVTVTSLDVGPDETFPVRIDLRLLRPLAGGERRAGPDRSGWRSVRRSELLWPRQVEFPAHA